MTIPEVTVIPWNHQLVDPILDKHLVHVRLGTSRGPDELLRECIYGLLNTHYDWFVTYIFSIVGMEVEGQEVSLGLMHFKGDIPDDLSERFKFAKLGRWVNVQKTEGIHLGLRGFSDFRKIVRKLRADLIGWAPGRFLEPVLIITSRDDGTPYIHDVKILTTKTPVTLTAHELYKDLTKYNPDSFMIWIKSAASIRIYRWGRLFGQIMRLRDVGGWTTRQVDRVIQIVQHAASVSGINISEQTCRELIVEPSISISESRRGATIVIMEEDSFNALESNWNRRGALVACKAKHAPLEEEHGDVTEAEYENYLAQDGAVIISPQGKLLGMGTYFQGGPGGRRDTAAWLPKVLEKCITIVTSQDGPIYLHWAEGEGNQKSGEGVRLDFISTSTTDPIQLDPEKEKEEVVVGVPDLT